MYFGILNEALLQPQKINPKLRKYQNGPLSYWVFLSRRKCVGLLYCLSAHEDIGHILQSSLILSLRSLLYQHQDLVICIMSVCDPVLTQNPWL